jgi:leader peptidase (prepilin peptidase) / N-methyltransferase
VIPPALATAYAFVLGLCVGSFLNVCIARWPHELSVVRPRSRCPKCGHQLAWFENIPLLSWIALRARCRCCDEPISAIYPGIELLVGVIWALIVHQYGASFTALRLGLFATLLLGVAITDLQHYLIPDGYTITGLITMLAGALLAPFLGESTIFAGPFDAIVGACAGAGLIAIVGWLGEAALGREAMGMGDMTLMAFVGAALGPARALATVFVGATIGAVAFLAIVYPIAMLRRGRGRTTSQTELALDSEQDRLRLPLVPFGVFLAPAAVVMLIWGDRLLGRVFLTPY